MKAKPIIATLSSILTILIVAAYFFGNHNFYFSRSYFLEKEIRKLLYFETHEPTNYQEAHERYKTLRQKIKFADTGEGLDERYLKATERAKLKAAAIKEIDMYHQDGLINHIQSALSILESDAFEKVSYYRAGHFCIYYQGKHLDRTWFTEKLKVEPIASGQRR